MPFSFKRNLIILVPALLSLLTGCAVTSMEYEPVKAGAPADLAAMVSSLESTPKGPIRFRKIVAADWAVARDGLINFEHLEALKAGLEEGLEPIQIYFYAIEHPQHGLFLVDTGMAAIFAEESDNWPVSSLVKSAMNMDKLQVRVTTKNWLEQNGSPRGVFLTHMHLDHILGSRDIDKSVPFYIGPDESTYGAFMNMFVQGTTDDVLGTDRKLQELRFPTPGANPSVAAADDPQKGRMRILDFFGDGSFYAIHVPGHTAGSMAFIVRSTEGLQLIVGDTCHTAWGWKHNVPPGSFTMDQEGNAHSLDALQSLVQELPGLRIHLGHQSL